MKVENDKIKDQLVTGRLEDYYIKSFVKEGVEEIKSRFKVTRYFLLAHLNPKQNPLAPGKN